MSLESLSGQTEDRPSAFWGALGILAVAAVCFAGIRSTNFAGYDEWMILDLLDSGTISSPHANRPLSLLFHAVPGLLFPDRLGAFRLAHLFYLAATGVLVFLILRCLPAPLGGRLGFLAGTFAALWGPTDDYRLNSVAALLYSGTCFAMTLAVLLLVRSWERQSPWLLAAAAGLASVTTRVYEGALPPLLAAPVLLVWARPRTGGRRALWLLAFEGPLLAAGAAVAWPVLFPAEASYQVSVLGLDPLGSAGRLVGYLRMYFAPLIVVPPGQLANPAVPLTVLAFLAVALLVLPRGPFDPSPRALGGGLAGGLAAAALGDALLSLGQVTGPARTQFLSAPGAGVALACGIGLVARGVGPRLRRPVLLLLASWVVALSAGGVQQSQRFWDAFSYYPAQSRALRDLVRLAPELEPDTLVILVDESASWPAGFAFRHAVHWLHAGKASGLVSGAWDPLYETRLSASGVSSRPIAALERGWGLHPEHYAFDQIVVVRQRRDKGLELLERWPSILQPLPPGARYDPLARIVSREARPALPPALSGR